eukprot:1237904-Amphidinium_carterae.1
MVIAMRHGVCLHPVEINKPGVGFTYPTEAALQHCIQNSRQGFDGSCECWYLYALPGDVHEDPHGCYLWA